MSYIEPKECGVHGEHEGEACTDCEWDDLVQQRDDALKRAGEAEAPRYEHRFFNSCEEMEAVYDEWEAAAQRHRRVEAQRDEALARVRELEAIIVEANRPFAVATLQPRLDASLAREAALREALEELLYRATHDGGMQDSPFTDAGIALEHARTALAEAPGEAGQGRRCVCDYSEDRNGEMHFHLVASCPVHSAPTTPDAPKLKCTLCGETRLKHGGMTHGYCAPAAKGKP